MLSQGTVEDQDIYKVQCLYSSLSSSRGIHIQAAVIEKEVMADERE